MTLSQFWADLEEKGRKEVAKQLEDMGWVLISREHVTAITSHLWMREGWASPWVAVESTPPGVRRLVPQKGHAIITAPSASELLERVDAEMKRRGKR